MNYFLIAHVTGHLASILTMVAYIVKDIFWLRFLAILSSLATIAFNYLVPATPLWTVIYWNLLFIAINTVQIAIIIRERAGVHFTDEEKELYDTLFKTFAPFEFMKLMRIAAWSDANKGDVLAVEHKPLENIMLIYNGLVSVERKGESVAQLKDGSFIGEISFMMGGEASATVRALEPTRYVAWPKERIRRLLNRNPSMRFAMQAVFSTDLSRKLLRRAPSFQLRRKPSKGQ